MSKTILITGSTDGIGLLTARTLAERGHRVLLHGRSQARLDTARAQVDGATETFHADLSSRAEVEGLAEAVRANHPRIDVLINNAGIYKTPRPRTADGLDLRFVVNTLAPWMLTRALLPAIPADGRIVNVASAAQAPVDPAAMTGQRALGDFEAYAQSKLALIVWTRALARDLPDGPVAVAVNPGSLLATKMVRDGFGVAGNDLGIGAGILCRAALEPDFATASGRYFDNDAGRFAEPHPWALDRAHETAVMTALDAARAALT